MNYGGVLCLNSPYHDLQIRNWPTDTEVTPLDQHFSFGPASQYSCEASCVSYAMNDVHLVQEGCEDFVPVVSHKVSLVQVDA